MQSLPLLLLADILDGRAVAAEAGARAGAPRLARGGANRLSHAVVAERVAVTVAKVVSRLPDTAGPLAVAATAAVVVLEVVLLKAELVP